MQSLLCLNPVSVEAWFDNNPNRLPEKVPGIASKKHCNPVFIIASISSEIRAGSGIYLQQHAAVCKTNLPVR